MSAASVLRRALPTMRILWAALLASVAIIAFMTTRLPAQPDAARPMAVLVLAGVAAGCAVASFVLPAIVYAGNLRRRRPEVREPGPREAFTYRSAAAAGDPIGEFAEPDMAAVQAVASGQVAFILRLALSEAVALLALPAHLLGARLRFAAIFVAAGAVLLMLRFPTRATVLGPYERFHKARFPAL